MEDEEIFKDVPGYEGLYEVSSIGRVRSFHFHNGTNERILSNAIDKNGYNWVRLYKDKSSHRQDVHRLIGMAFFGYNTCNRKYVMNHIDGNPSNNTISNLEIVTSRANASTCYRKNKDRLSSKYVGVSWYTSRRRWRASIQINKKNLSLGYFLIEEEASIAYQSALQNHLNSVEKC